jgi:hypothetical protein
VQFIKFAFSTELGFQSVFGLSVPNFQKHLSQAMLSTGRSAPYILCTAVKFGTDLLLLLWDQNLEFTFINIRFCRDLGGWWGIWMDTGFSRFIIIPG